VREREEYEKIAVCDMHEIRDNAFSKFGLQEGTLIHWRGTVQVGEDILLIGVSSGHLSQGICLV